MRTYKGIMASSGMVIGPVERIDRGAVGLHRIVSDPFRERALYEAAIVLAKDELQRLQQHAQGNDADILIFQIALLEDESFTNEIGDYIAAGAGSAAAVERAEQIFAGRLNNVDDAYIRERSVDVRDACRRVIDILDGRPRRRLHLDHPVILAADVFFPTDLLSVDRKLILGLASDNDSETSHAAIMARSMGIPAVCRLGEGVAALSAGRQAILDAGNAMLVLDPTPQQLAAAHRRMVRLAKAAQTPDPLAGVPCRTKDGTSFVMLSSANISSPEQISAGIKAGASEVGLIRTESMFVNAVPEEEQYQAYLSCMEHAGGRPVAIRTGDAGATDNMVWTDGMQIEADYDEMLHTQLRALLRAAARGKLRVVVPMVRDTTAWETFLQKVETCKQELRERGETFREDMPIGCMIEIPAAALLAGDLIDHGADFLTIDIDDLTRCTFGILRKDAKRDFSLDTPAVMRLVRTILLSAAQRNTPIYLCGIAGADLESIPAFLHAGARGFCTEPAFLNALKAKLIQEDLSTPPDCLPE